MNEIIVHTPDGRTLYFPAGTPAAEIERVAQEPAPAPQPTPIEAAAPRVPPPIDPAAVAQYGTVPLIGPRPDPPPPLSPARVTAPTQLVGADLVPPSPPAPAFDLAPSNQAQPGVAGDRMRQTGDVLAEGMGRATRTIGEGLRAAGRGALDMATLGFDDEILGGLWGLIPGGLTPTQSIDAQRQSKALAREASPLLFAMGGLAGLAATVVAAPAAVARVVAPALTPFRGTTAMPRAANAALTGALTGGVYGAGTADGGNMLQGAGIGAGTGAAIGPAGPLLGASVRGVRNLATSAVSRGTAAPSIVERAAANRVNEALQRDTGAVNPLVRRSALLANAQTAGVPMILADTGEEATRGLMRAATNTSPVARHVVNTAVNPRFEAQADRVRNTLAPILNISPAGGTIARREALETQAAALNRPAYDAAYAAGQNGVWTQELAQLTRSQDVHEAIRAVGRPASADAALTGRRIVSPAFVSDGAGGLRPASGAVPTLEFWDHVHRNLASEIGRIGRTGASARDVTRLNSALLRELDNAVPQFRVARQGAATFFGAQDAFEAGQIMARDMRMSTADFRILFNRLSNPEKDLFRESFGGEIMDRLGRSADNSNAVNQNMFNNPTARERSAIVYGQTAADTMENVVRFENIMNATRQAAQGNSNTAQYIADMLRRGATSPAGMATVVGTISALPAMLSTGALTVATLIPALMTYAARKSFTSFNEAVMTEVGQLLATGSPEAVQRAARIIAQTPNGNIVMRQLEMALSRAAAAPVIQSAETDIAALQSEFHAAGGQ